MIKPWMVIGGVTIGLALAISALMTPKGTQWFRRLRRPNWLTFEGAIPVIWTVIFVCAAWSATIVWNHDPGSRKTWMLMGAYILLELVTLAYTPVMTAVRSLKVGTIIGATGLLIALILALFVLPVSGGAALLLLPYLLWSPIGTYTTWQMAQLNPADT